MPAEELGVPVDEASMKRARSAAEKLPTRSSVVPSMARSCAWLFSASLLLSCSSGACAGVPARGAPGNAAAPQPTAAGPTREPQAPIPAVIAAPPSPAAASTPPTIPFDEARGAECARLFPRRAIRLVQYPTHVVSELRDILQRIAQTSGKRAQVALVIDDLAFFHSGHLAWVQTALGELLAAGARVAVLRGVSEPGGPASFALEQSWTTDPVLARRAVIRSASSGLHSEAPTVRLEQLELSAGALAHVVVLGGCNDLLRSAESIRAWAHEHDVTFDELAFYSSPSAVPALYRGQDMNPSQQFRGPRVEDLRALMGEVTYHRARDESALYTMSAELVMQLAAGSEPHDLLLAVASSSSKSVQRAGLAALSAAGRAFVARHPGHRIALAREDGELVLPLTHDAVRFEAALQGLGRRQLASGGLFRVYRPGEKLAWADAAKHTVVQIVRSMGEPYDVELVDWLSQQRVQVHLVEQWADGAREDAWDPAHGKWLEERCLVVEQDDGVSWPANTPPAARCDIAHSPLAPSPAWKRGHDRGAF